MTKVVLIEKMGSDLSIVRTARLTSNKNDEQAKEDPASIASLIRFLMRHKHTSPFEFCKLHFEIECSIAVARQILRHRMANVNEFSQRYSEVPHTFDVERGGRESRPWRGQSANNRQSSAGEIKYNPGEYSTAEVHGLSAESVAMIEYERRIQAGVAREQARMCLPLGITTRFRWCVDLHNLFHFLRLRTKSDAQHETAEVARKIMAITREHFPIAFAAFADYVLNSIVLSALDIKTIIAYPIGTSYLSESMMKYTNSIGMSRGEFREHLLKREVLAGQLTMGELK